MKRRLTALILIGVLSARSFAQSDAVGINALPKSIKERNQRVAAARINLQAAQRESGYLGRSFLPEIEAVAGRESFRTGTEDLRTEPFGTIGANLNIFRSGKDRLRDASQSAAVVAAQASLNEVYREELQKARQTFWMLSFQREMAHMLEAALKQNAAFLQVAQRKINSGLSTKIDNFEFEIQRREIEYHLTRLRAEENKAQKTLTLLIGEKYFNTPERIPHDHDDALLTVTFDPESHPSMQSVQAAGAAESAAAKIAGRWWTPSVDLYSNYSLYTFREREYQEQSDRNETVAGGMVSFKFGEGVQGLASSKASLLRAASYQTKRELTKQELVLQVQVAKETLEELHNLVHASEENVELGERYLKATRDEYTRGIKNSPDLAGAVEKIVSAQRRSAEVRLDYQLLKAELLALVEKP